MFKKFVLLLHEQQLLLLVVKVMSTRFLALKASYTQLLVQCAGMLASKQSAVLQVGQGCCKKV